MRWQVAVIYGVSYLGEYRWWGEFIVADVFLWLKTVLGDDTTDGIYVSFLFGYGYF